MTDVTGQAGKYLLIDTLGSGAFSKVKRGVHEDTREEVAVKIIKKDLLVEKNAANMMRRELTIMQSLKHKYITKLITVMSSAKKIYVVMELAPNGDLYDVISTSNGEGLEDALAKEYFRQLLEAVQFCHKKGVCHRDLKPENVLIASDGSIRLSDFGLSAICKKGPDGAQDDLMRTICGTPAYVAPEVVGNPKGTGYHGKENDAWGCGVILYTLVVGYLPFDGDTLEVMLNNVLSAKLEVPSKVSDGARSLLHALLERDTKKRFTIDQALAHDWFKPSRTPDKDIPKKMEKIASYFYLPKSSGDLAPVVHKKESVDRPLNDTASEIEDVTNKSEFSMEPGANQKGTSSIHSKPSDSPGVDRPKNTGNSADFHTKLSTASSAGGRADFARVKTIAQIVAEEPDPNEASLDRVKMEKMVRRRTTAQRMMSKRFHNPAMPNAPVEAPTFQNPTPQGAPVQPVAAATQAAPTISPKAPPHQSLHELDNARLPAAFFPTDSESDSEDESNRKSYKDLEGVAQKLKAGLITTNEIRDRENLSAIQALVTAWGKEYRTSDKPGAKYFLKTAGDTKNALKTFKSKVLKNNATIAKCSWSEEDVRRMDAIVNVWIQVLEDQNPNLETWMADDGTLYFLQSRFVTWEATLQGANAPKEVNMGEDLFPDLSLSIDPSMDRHSAASAKSGGKSFQIKRAPESFIVPDPVRSGKAGDDALVVDGMRNRPLMFEKQSAKKDVPENIKNLSGLDIERSENMTSDLSLGARAKSARPAGTPVSFKEKLKGFFHKGLSSRSRSVKESRQNSMSGSKIDTPNMEKQHK